MSFSRHIYKNLHTNKYIFILIFILQIFLPSNIGMYLLILGWASIFIINILNVNKTQKITEDEDVYHFPFPNEYYTLMQFSATVCDIRLVEERNLFSVSVSAVWTLILATEF